jgi:pimeloyl-ACP methyl ester carboxylesterase
MNRIKHYSLFALILLLTACVSVSRKPDLSLLYGNKLDYSTPRPIIIIPGLMGSSLETAEGLEVWPGSITDLAFSDYEALTDAGLNLKPGRVIDGLAGVDFYGALTKTLEQAANYRLAMPGQVQNVKNQRRYYLFAYDWRQSNAKTAVRLHELIEQIRRDFSDPALKVDLIAHSNGGLIARYYLQYGPTDTDQPNWQPEAWAGGGERIRRLAMLGTPNLGSVISVLRLYEGYKMGVRTIPLEVMVQFATPFETMPIPQSHVIIDANGTAQDIDLYDINTWKNNQWSVFSPAFRQQMQSEQPDSPSSEKRVMALQEVFSKNLATARKIQTALSVPFMDGDTEIALFGGDCIDTRFRALAERRNGQTQLFAEAGDLEKKSPNVDYQYLLFGPGDGLVTRASQVARAQDVYAQQVNADLFKASQTVFLCERHSMLTANPFFQNNLLYFLLR